MQRYEANRLTVTRQLALRAGLDQDARPVPVRERAPGRDCGVEEPAHRPDRRACDRAVPHRPRPEERDLRPTGGRALRRRHRAGRDDDPPRGRRRRASCRSTGATTGAPATRRTRTGTAPPTCGSRSGSGTPGSTCWPGSCMSRSRPTGAEGARATVIFPRYHQWDAVLASKPTPRATAPGSDYLVQHSAGSGKSNTIAWLAHRLSTLHDDRDAKVFDKVVVITDRGCSTASSRTRSTSSNTPTASWRRSTRTPQQLAEALAGEQARIIITTLQKFPFVLDKVESSCPPALRGDRRRGPLVADRRGGQGPKLVLGGEADPRSSSTAAEAEDAGRAPSRSMQSRRRSPRRSPRGASSRTCRSSRSPRHPRRARWSCSAARPGHRAVRAVPPLLDAPGHRGGLHPRRARQLRHLRDVLEHREADRRRPGVRLREGPQARSPGSSASTSTTWPRRPRSSSSTSASTSPIAIGGQAKAMVVTVVAAARGALQAGARPLHHRAGYGDSACSSPSPGRSIDDGVDVHRGRT